LASDVADETDLVVLEPSPHRQIMKLTWYLLNHLPLTICGIQKKNRSGDSSRDCQSQVTRTQIIGALSELEVSSERFSNAHDISLYSIDEVAVQVHEDQATSEE
jgi:enoyl-[acyl-carrier-protein] reductase (NADH)